jgi:hypothetical protein
MKRMTILMIVFLPLTFATGYFVSIHGCVENDAEAYHVYQGMNFNPFPVVKEHSDILFWQIMLPVMAVVVPWAMWNEILRIFRMFGRVRLLSRVDQKQNAKVKAARRREQTLRRKMSVKEEEGEKSAA